MHFLSTFRNLCTDCFPFFKGNISNLHYDYVEGVENSWHQEETAAWNANSDRSNPNTNNLEMIEANKSSSVSTNISFKENNNEKIVEEKIIKKVFKKKKYKNFNFFETNLLKENYLYIVHAIPLLI